MWSQLAHCSNTMQRNLGDPEGEKGWVRQVGAVSYLQTCLRACAPMCVKLWTINKSIQHFSLEGLKDIN